ncbi:MAG: hypothetical protein KJ052_09660, partial [Candidatus Hydrogenedentes bacterium]|nr:hypothetical protein [Candidatus Hydrogenedentota bacterium]
HPEVEVQLSDLTDLEYRFYRNTFDALPDFEQLRPETTGKLDHNYISLAPASRPDAIGFVYEGQLRVPTA